MDPGKRNFDIFRPRIFRKIAERNSKLEGGKSTRKMEKLLFHRNHRKILIRGNQRLGIFKPRIKSYEAFSIFWPSAILELVIFNYVTYGYIIYRI